MAKLTCGKGVCSTIDLQVLELQASGGGNGASKVSVMAFENESSSFLDKCNTVLFKIIVMKLLFFNPNYVIEHCREALRYHKY